MLVRRRVDPGMKLLSCPYFVTTEGGQEQLPGKRAIVFLRSDDVAIYSLHVSVWLLFKGGVYFARRHQ